MTQRTLNSMYLNAVGTKVAVSQIQRGQEQIFGEHHRPDGQMNITTDCTKTDTWTDRHIDSSLVLNTFESDQPNCTTCFFLVCPQKKHM